jgi:hypothetical protein
LFSWEKHVTFWFYIFFNRKKGGKHNFLNLHFFFEKAVRKTNVIFPISKLQKKRLANHNFENVKKRKTCYWQITIFGHAKNGKQT